MENAEEEKFVGPTPERVKRAGDDFEKVDYSDNVHYGAIRMLDGSPLIKLVRLGQKSPRKGITGPQFEAGTRYFSDAYYAGLLASGVVDLSRTKVDGGGYKDISDHRIAAQTRFNRACKALGPVHRHVLDDIVLAECHLTAYADRFREFPRHRDRMLLALGCLREALDALDIHYNGHRNNRYRRSHLADDYRPSIPPAGAREKIDS